MPLRSDVFMREFNDLKDCCDTVTRYHRAGPLSTHTGKMPQPCGGPGGLMSVVCTAPRPCLTSGAFEQDETGAFALLLQQSVRRSSCCAFVRCRRTALRDIPTRLPISPSARSRVQCKIKTLFGLCGKAEKTSVKVALFKENATNNTSLKKFFVIFDLETHTDCLGAGRPLVVNIHRIKIAHIFPSLWIL